MEWNFISFKVGKKGTPMVVSKDEMKGFKDNEAMMSYLYDVIVPWYRRKLDRANRRTNRKIAFRKFKTKLKNLVGIKTPGQKTKDTVETFYNWWEEAVEKEDRLN